MVYRHVLIQWGMENPLVSRNRYISSDELSKMLKDALSYARKDLDMLQDKTLRECHEILDKYKVITTPQQLTHRIAIDKYSSECLGDDLDNGWIEECLENATLIVYGYANRVGRENIVDVVENYVFFGNTIDSIQYAIFKFFQYENKIFHYAGFLYKSAKLIGVETFNAGTTDADIDNFLSARFIGNSVSASTENAVAKVFSELLPSGYCPIHPRYHSVKCIEDDLAGSSVPWCKDIVQLLLDGTDIIETLLKIQINAAKNNDITSQEQSSVEIVYGQKSAYVGTEEFREIITNVVMDYPHYILSSIDPEYSPRIVRILVFDGKTDGEDWWKKVMRTDDAESADLYPLLIGAWLKTSCTRIMRWPPVSLFRQLAEDHEEKNREKETSSGDHDDVI